MVRRYAALSIYAVSAFSAGLSSALAQSCNIIREVGIYDTSQSAASEQLILAAMNSFCGSSQRQSQEQGNTGISVPIPKLPDALGVNASNASYRNYVQNICREWRRSQRADARFAEVVQTINPIMAEVLGACLSRSGLHVWLEYTHRPDQIVIASRYISDLAGTSSPERVSIDQVVGADCGAPPPLRWEVGGSTYTRGCRRLGDDAISIVANGSRNIVDGGNLGMPARTTNAEESRPDPVFLSDLEAVEASNIRGRVWRNRPYWREDIVINGQTYTKGIVLHPNQEGVTRVRYRVPPGMRLFSAVLGMADGRSGPCGGSTWAGYRIFVDNQLIRSGRVYHGSVENLQVPIAGQTFTIETDKGDDNIHCDQVTFANAGFN